MTVSAIIKDRLKEIGMTQTELATKLNTTRQNFNNKMSRDNFSAKELYEISKILETELTMIDNTGKKYSISYDK
jgi:transcriptional regulator with XRE-family HTH domain